MSWYRKAAEQHYSAALRNLGHCYEYGIGLEQPDMQEALNYYQQAAQLNDQGARVDVVRFYDRNRCGLQGDYLKVKEMFRELAEQNVAEAQVEWARRIFDDEEALRLYRAAALECGEGAYQLAECYRLGKRGLEQDPAEAHKWYREAARRGHILGMTAYADGLSDTIRLESIGTSRWVPSEREKWYRRAIVLGHVPAMVKLAELYSQREEAYSRQREEKAYLGVSSGHQECCDQMLYWYEKAEEAKSETVDVVTQLKLAELYDPRKPVKMGFRKDEEKAIEWYRRIVKRQVPHSMHHISTEAWDALTALNWRKVTQK